MPANLLLITFDQWRGDWTDPVNPVVPLPALYELAQRGWTARRCLTSSPVCVPARMSWLTGLQPSQLGVTRNVEVMLPPDAPSVVRNIQQLGWYTAVVGKTHWNSHGRPRDLREDAPLLKALGFDQAVDISGPRGLRRIECALTEAWRDAGCLDLQRQDLERRYAKGRSPDAWTVRPTILPTELYPDVWIARQAQLMLASMPVGQPWLLWVSFVGPHEPFDTPPPWNTRFSSAQLPDPTGQPLWWRDLDEQCELRRSQKIWHGLLDSDAIAACRVDYAGHLSLLDDLLADLIGCLKKRKDYDKTALLVTADHGEVLGDGGLLYKSSFLEGAIRVPWVYCPPANVSDEGRGTATMTPLSLTGLFDQVFASLPSNGSSLYLRKWAEQQCGAVVEFGTERLMVQGMRKLAVDWQGAPLWAVDLGLDPYEQVDVIRQRPVAWRLSPAWRKLRQWARKDTHMRSSPNWIWRWLSV